MTGRLAFVFWLGLASVAGAGAESARYRFYKYLDRGDATGDVLLAVPLDGDVHAATRDGYPDISILDNHGAPVSYLLDKVAKRRTVTTREACSSKVASLRVDQGEGLEIVVELADKAPSAGGLTIRTPLVDYERRVRVFGSRDGVDWAPLGNAAVVFDYSRFMDVRNREIVLPANEFRRYKLLIDHQFDERESPLRELSRSSTDGGKDQRTEITQSLRRPFRVDGIDLWRTVEKEGPSDAVSIPHPTAGFEVVVDAKAKVARVEVKSRREPLTRFSITSSSRNFSRPAAVLVPVKRGLITDWVEVGRGTLSRIEVGSFRRSDLTIDFPEQRQESYQIVIENGDNAPVEVAGVEAFGPAYRLLFLGAAGLSYRLEYGWDQPHADRYDVAAVEAALRQGVEPVNVTPGPEFANPDLVSEPPSRDFWNNPVFLSLAIVATVLVLAWALFHAGRRIKTPPEEEL